MTGEHSGVSDEPRRQTGNHPAESDAAVDWDFPNLGGLWDSMSGAIMTGADRLDGLTQDDRAHSVDLLGDRVRTLAGGLDDGWLVATAFFMVEDLYKSFFYLDRWSAGIEDYIAATAGVFMQVVTRRGFALHYVIDNTQSESRIAEALAYVPAIFHFAGLLVAGPQLMALELMQQADDRRRDVTAIPRYRNEGHHVADLLITRCHQERRSSVYLNLDLDDDSLGLPLEVALSQRGTPGTIVVFRNQPPYPGSVAEIVPPPGVSLPDLGQR